MHQVHADCYRRRTINFVCQLVVPLKWASINEQKYYFVLTIYVAINTLTLGWVESHTPVLKKYMYNILFRFSASLLFFNCLQN